MVFLNCMVHSSCSSRQRSKLDLSYQKSAQGRITPEDQALNFKREMSDLRQVVAVFYLLFALADANVRGPPVSTSNVCADMFPAGHNAQAQPDDDAVNITLGKDCYEANKKILVTVDFNRNGNMKGIFVQARKTSGNTTTNDPLGTFETSGDTQPMTAYECNNSTESAWGHNNALSARQVKFYWKAPSSDQKDIQLVMTVVKVQNTFWTFQKSAVMKFCSSASSISAATSALVTVLMVITALLC